VAVGVVDAAGNETRVERPEELKTDNHAPAAPVGLVSPGPVSTVDRFDVHWALPVDDGAPIVAARYQVCQAGACGGVEAASSLTAVEGLALPGVGEGTVRVWLVDALGHEAPGQAAELVINYRPEPAAAPALGSPVGEAALGVAPVTIPRPSEVTPPHGIKKADPALKIASVRTVGRRVTVRGTVSAKASGRVVLRLRAKAPARGSKAYVITARPRIAKRRFVATLVLPRALVRARAATLTATYPGDADTRSGTRQVTVRRRR
jgi:hypothetical protein